LQVNALADFGQASSLGTGFGGDTERKRQCPFLDQTMECPGGDDPIQRDIATLFIDSLLNKLYR